MIPRHPSRAALKRSKCVNVRVQTTKPAAIRVAIFSGRKSVRVFGATTVRFAKPGKRLVCIRVPLRAHTFDVRKPFRFAFAVRSSARTRAKIDEGHAHDQRLPQLQLAACDDPPHAACRASEPSWRSPALSALPGAASAAPPTTLYAWSGGMAPFQSLHGAHLLADGSIQILEVTPANRASGAVTIRGDGQAHARRSSRRSGPAPPPCPPPGAGGLPHHRRRLRAGGGRGEG